MARKTSFVKLLRPSQQGAVGDPSRLARWLAIIRCGQIIESRYAPLILLPHAQRQRVTGLEGAIFSLINIRQRRNTISIR